MARLAGASYAGTALALVTGPLVARALGPAGRGEVAAATVYAGILALVVGLGLPTAVSHAAATKAHSPGALLAAVLRFAGWLTLPVLGLAFVAVRGPLAELSAGGRLGAAVLLAVVPVSVLATCLESVLVAEGALGPMTRIRFVPLLFSALATVVLYALGALTVGRVLLLAIAVTIGTAAGLWRMVGVRAGSRAPLRPLLGYGLRGYGGGLAVFATHMVDQAFILPVLGARSLGFYALAVTIASVPNTVGLAIYARYFSLVAEEPDPSARAEVISRGIRTTLLASLGACLVVAVLAPPLVPFVYGREFADAVTPLLLLLPGTVLFCMSMVAASFLAALGRPGRLTFAELAGVAVSLACLPVVVPRYGIRGAAVLSTLSYGLVLAMYLSFLRPFGPLRLRIGTEDLSALWADVRLAIPRSRPPGPPAEDGTHGRQAR